MAVLLNERHVYVVFVDGNPHLFLRRDNAIDYANACMEVDIDDDTYDPAFDYNVVEGPYEIGFDDWPK